MSDIDRVTAIVRDRISNGEYAPGAKLPTAATLAAELDVATTTVGNAYRLLAAEGLVATQRRVGTVVRRPFVPIERTPGEDAPPERVRYDQVTVETLIPPPWAESALDTNASVLARRALLIADGERIVGRVAAYYPAELATTALAMTDPGPGGATACLAEAGHELVHRSERLAWRSATSDEVEQLDLWRTDGIAVVTRTGSDRSGRCVEAVRLDLVAAAWQLITRFGGPRTGSRPGVAADEDRVEFA